MLLSNAEFIERLKALFKAREAHGSVFLTQKRYSYDDAMPEDRLHAVDEHFPVLLRATDGKKSKLSTVVQAGEIDKFSALYISLLRASFTTLRKRDKKKERQKKGKAATELPRIPKIVGPRRGAGHAKRQASIKRRLKALARLRASKQPTTKQLTTM